MSLKKRAVFLDRDGTINIEKNYLHRVADFEFIPGAPEAIARLNAAGFLVIVVTNQAGIGRGYYGVDEVNLLHDHLQKEIARYGATVDGFFICPHHPTEGVGNFRTLCSCRKGEPGMLYEARDQFDIDLAESYMVGDKISDVEAGLKAGCQCILVLTGYGASEKHKLKDEQVVVVTDIAAAADLILQNRDETSPLHGRVRSHRL